jgi:hypothetical protein
MTPASIGSACLGLAADGFVLSGGGLRASRDPAQASYRRDRGAGAVARTESPSTNDGGDTALGSARGTRVKRPVGTAAWPAPAARPRPPAPPYRRGPNAVETRRRKLGDCPYMSTPAL